MENVQIHREIKLVTTERRRNYLLSKPNYDTKIFFTENLLAKKMKTNSNTHEKFVYLRLLILQLSKTVMYDFWYDNVKPKYGEKSKLCSMDKQTVSLYT